MSVENLSEEKDWNMLGTLKSLKAVLDDLMEQEEIGIKYITILGIWRKMKQRPKRNYCILQ